MPDRKRHLKLVKSQYTLCYGMRLDKGTSRDRGHPHVPVRLPDDSEATMALHLIHGTAAEIKVQLLESVDAFFEIYGER